MKAKQDTLARSPASPVCSSPVLPQMSWLSQGAPISHPIPGLTADNQNRVPAFAYPLHADKMREERALRGWLTERTQLGSALIFLFMF